MRPASFFVALILIAATAATFAQEPSPPKRSWLGRVLHPFGSAPRVPVYKDARLKGLALQVQLPPGPVKLSETRQLPVIVRLTNRGDHAIELNFPTEQRIEIYLRDARGAIVTRWSDNHAFEAKSASILINPNEHLEYAETIATRDLAPNGVFTVEVLVPAYPELDTKRKSIAAP
jgi:hypothetical protein